MKRVYFLRPVGQLGPIKIGCSKLPPLRLETLTTWSPVRLELICSVPGTHKDERTLHGMFAQHHVHGEWFGASKELLALIAHCEAHGQLPELPEVLQFPKVRHVGHKGRAAGRREPGELPPHKMEIARLMRGQLESGMAARDIAEEHSVSYQTALRYIRAAGGSLKRGARQTAAGVQDTDRAKEFERRYLAGETLQQIADDYGITRERVRQVLRRIGVPSLGLRPEHRTKPHELTADEIAAAKAYESGTPPRDIERRFGLARHQILTACDRLGISRNAPGCPFQVGDPQAVIAKVEELYRKGVRTADIAEEVGLCHQTEVYRWLKRAGIEPSRRPRRLAA